MEVIPEKALPIPPDPPEEEDNDDGQWSDWEQPIEVLPRISNSRAKWDPNAPLGSEYEIPPLAPSKKKETTTTTTSNNVDDFFADMTPQVQTVQLMQQLETMFHVDTAASRFGILPEDQSEQPEDPSASNWDD